MAMSTQIVTYLVNDSTGVRFEIEPGDGFRPADAGKVLGKVSEAIGPAVEAAKAVLAKAKEVQPDELEVRFGVKVTGGADWIIAKAAGEGSFEITFRWKHDSTAANVDAE
jgi:hypothetical protein